MTVLHYPLLLPARQSWQAGGARIASVRYAGKPHRPGRSAALWRTRSA